MDVLSFFLNSQFSFSGRPISAAEVSKALCSFRPDFTSRSISSRRWASKFLQRHGRLDAGGEHLLAPFRDGLFELEHIFRF
jgi:hypothetical protein